MICSPHKTHSPSESFEVLDINWLKQRNYIPDIDEYPKKSTLHWISSRGRKSSSEIITLHEKLILMYRWDNEPIKNEILLDWQTITLKYTSTYRPWMLCPSCGDRKAKLYLRNKNFLCKPCNRLVNRSSQQGKVDREISKARKILKDLDLLDCCNTLDTSTLHEYMKPKGMHRNTFKKLQSKYRRARFQSFALHPRFKSLLS